MAKLVAVRFDAPVNSFIEVTVRTVAAAKLHGEALYREYGPDIVSIHVFHTKWVEDILVLDKTKPYYRLMKKGGWAQHG